MVADGINSLILPPVVIDVRQTGCWTLLYFAFVAAPNGAVRTLKYRWGDADGRRFRHGPTTRKKG